MPKFYRILIAGLIVWYLFLCSHHYLNARPLWNDEDCVLKSLQQFDTIELFTKQLLSWQVFPRVYLSVIQKTAQLFNYRELALRFWPFVVMILVFFLWGRIILKTDLTKTELAAWIATWSGSIAMIYYSAELKQYSMDVLTGALFTLFLCNQNKWQEKRDRLYYIAFLGLPFLAFFSYIAFIFMILPLYNLILSTRNDQKAWRDVVFYGLISIGVFLTSNAIDMRFTPSVVYSRSGHGDYFIYFDSIGEFLKTTTEGINNLFSRWYAETPKIFRKIARVFAILGLIQLFVLFFRNFKKNQFYFNRLETIGFALFGAQLALGALHKYPFSEPRTSLFYAPFVFYYTVKGIGSIKTANRYLYFVVLFSYCVFILIVSLGLAREIIGGDLGAQSAIWQ